MSDNCKPTSHIPVPEPPGYCCDIKLSKCIYYDGPTLCIDINQNAFLHEVLEEISTVLCTPDIDVSAYNYQCLTSYNINTEQDFINAVVDVLCNIIGAEDIGTITSRDDILLLLTNVQNEINRLNTVTIATCFAPLSGLSGTATLSQFIAATQQSLCNLDTLIDTVDDKLIRISAADTTSGYLSEKVEAGTNATLTVINPGGVEQLQLSANSVTGVGLLSQDTTTVDTTISGIDLKTVSASVKRSLTSTNLVKNTGNGLYVSVNDVINQILNSSVLKSALCDLCT